MSHATLHRRLTQRLIPPGDWRADAGPARSDFDLNPGMDRSGNPLRPAAVLVPIVAHDTGATVILTRRADTLSSHRGQIAFPGGRLDGAETAVQAALREANEEIGLDPAAVEILGLGDAYETGTGFLMTPVVGWLNHTPIMTASPAEVADIFETPWDFLMDVANHRREQYELPDGPPRQFWSMPWQDRYIWGATAGVIRALHGRLYGEEADCIRAEAEDAA